MHSSSIWSVLHDSTLRPTICQLVGCQYAMSCKTLKLRYDFCSSIFYIVGSTGWVPPISNFLPLNLMKLGFIVVAVFGVSFGPFIALVMSII